MMITALASIGSTWAVPNFFLPRYLISNEEPRTITCHKNLTNGSFYLGDIQFQTVYKEGLKSRRIPAKNQASWEKLCHDLDMQLINETHVFFITTELQSEEVWKLISSGYSYYWLTNKTPERHG